MDKRTWLSLGLLLILGGLFIIQALSKLNPLPDDIQYPVPAMSVEEKIPTILTEDSAYRLNVEKAKIENLKLLEDKRKSLEILNSARFDGNEETCLTISHTGMRDDCISEARTMHAIIERDSSLCESLTGSTRDKCKSSILFINARDNASVDFCNSISVPEIKEQCMKEAQEVHFEKQMSQIKKGIVDIKLCDSYTDSSIKENCIRRVKNQEDLTTLSQAIESNDSNMCTKISDEKMRTDCENEMSFSLAKTELSITPCLRIVDEGRRSQCVLFIGNIKDTQAYNQARLSNSIEGCALIESESLRFSCEDTISIVGIIESNAIEMCDTLKDISFQESCKKTISATP